MEHSILRFKAQVARNQRLRACCEVVVKPRPILSHDLQDVTKSFRNKQGDSTSFSLQQCVGRDRRAVNKKAYCLGVNVLLAESSLGSRQHGFTGLMRCARLFEKGKFLTLLIETHYVGEGS